jgi:Platelet-activating factor acetylhydrolase, isoform II
MKSSQRRAISFRGIRRTATSIPLRMLNGRNRLFRLGLALALSLGVLTLTILVALRVTLPVFHFPSPGGPYAIGTLTYHWVDSDRSDVFSTDAKARRELMVQIWYPAKATEPSSSPSPRAPYVQDASALANALARLKNLPTAVFGQFKYVTTHAVPGAPVANEKPNHPVLIFLEGAIGFRQMNTFQVEELVSQGYIVAAIDQPHTAAVVVIPDGREVGALPLDQMTPLIRQSHSPAGISPMLGGRAFDKGIVPYLAEDVSFTLNQLATLNQADPNAILTGRLDLRRVGTFGVSLGGIVGSETCRIEKRLRACLFMDAPMPVKVVESGLQQPALWITRDVETMRLERRRSGGWSEEAISEHQTSMQAAFARSQGARYFVQVPGMFHVNLTDIPYWSPLLPWLGITGPIDAQRAHHIINAYSLSFFNKHLLGHTEALMDAPASQYPEVIFSARKP